MRGRRGRCECCGERSRSTDVFDSKGVLKAGKMKWGARLCGECAYGVHETCQCSAAA